MRDLKFRAWNKLDNKMFPSVGVDDGGCAVIDTRAHRLYPIKGESILMQYTGLNDKNGKEIYEGDIVIHLKYGGDWEIVWLIDACGFSLKGKGENLMHLSRLCEPNIEVIGNIYETTTNRSVVSKEVK